MVGVIQILGGLALFMFGIRLLSGGMEKLAGNQIQLWLDRVTNRRVKSAAFGAVATALIQSSGLLMVTMIGLINANLMTLEQSIGVMLGQEIGTTLTAQIVAFEIGNFRLILVILGILLLELFPRGDLKKFGQILMGLGIIFVGMSYMAEALDHLIEIPWVSQALVTMGQFPMVGVIAGLVMTALTQSSTAVTSMVVAMGMSQAITLEGAVGIILGANIGSCITGLIASISLSRPARRASMAQITINILGVLIFLPFITQYVGIIEHTSGDLPRQIANAHTIFNVSVSALLFPFVKPIAKFATWLVPDKGQEEKTKATSFIDEMQFSVPAVALKEAARELNHLGGVTAEMLEQGCRALIDSDTTCAEQVVAQENRLADPISKELGDFINVLMRAELSVAQQKRCIQLKNLLVDIERVGDYAEDIALYAVERVVNDIPFSIHAIEELELLCQHTQHTYLLALQALQNSNREQAKEVCCLEAEFDRLYWQTRRAHIERLEAGLCHPEADVIFTETLRNLERISDHADNLGVSVVRS